MVGLLEDPKETDAYHLSRVARALAELAANVEPNEAAAVAGCGAQGLVDLLEDRKETDADRLPGLAEALAPLLTKIEPKEAAAVAERGAQGLVGLLQDPKETDADRLAALGQVLGTLSLAIRSARQTQLLALSHMLWHQVPRQDEVGEEVVIRLCELLAPQDLADVLKWPLAVGEAETIVLASLEKKTGKQFSGDVWKFVEQGQALGIKDIGLPAKRPRVEDALEELDELREGTADR